MPVFQGKALRVAPDMNTDVIIPARFMQDWDNLGKHVFKGESDELARRANESAFVVAGKNFGCGSSREQAVMAIKQAGVKAVIAPSFASIFYRNSVNLALTLLEGTVDCEDGAQLEVDTDAGLVRETTSGRTWSVQPLPPEVKRIVDDGGLIPHLQKKMGAGGKTP